MSEEFQYDNNIKQKQRNTIIGGGLRSEMWGVFSAVFIGAAYAAFTGGLGLVAGVAGLAALFGGYKAFTTEADTAVNMEDINAQRTASYTARALVQELKKEGVLHESPKRADGLSWVEAHENRQSLAQGHDR